jgi:hypothetical protein
MVLHAMLGMTLEERDAHEQRHHEQLQASLAAVQAVQET